MQTGAGSKKSDLNPCSRKAYKKQDSVPQVELFFALVAKAADTNV
jgi:hypothetical protein